MSIATTNQNVPADPMTLLRKHLTSLTGEFRRALPSHISPEKFARVVTTVASLNPDLIGADRKSLLGACMRCAADGLVPDGREAALVPFGKTVQYMPMMAGLLKKIRNSDAVASVQAHIIYENDEFIIRRGIVDTLEHAPKFPGDRGKAIGAYAVARFKDGSDPQFEVMDLAQIEKVRNVSKAKNAGTWTGHWDEMARKTVFRRLAKWLPMDAEVDQVMRRDDESGEVIEGGQTIDAVVDANPPAIEHKSASLDALEADLPSHDAQTGEVIDAQPEPWLPGAIEMLRGTKTHAQANAWAASQADEIAKLTPTDKSRWQGEVREHLKKLPNKAPDGAPIADAQAEG